MERKSREAWGLEVEEEELVRSFMSSSSMASGVNSPEVRRRSGRVNLYNFLPPSTTLMLTVAVFDLWLEHE